MSERTVKRHRCGALCVFLTSAILSVGGSAEAQKASIPADLKEFISDMGGLRGLRSVTVSVLYPGRSEEQDVAQRREHELRSLVTKRLQTAGLSVLVADHARADTGFFALRVATDRMSSLNCPEYFAFNVTGELSQASVLTRNGSSRPAVTWSDEYLWLVPAEVYEEKLRVAVEEVVRDFLLAFSTANGKKK